MMTSKEIMFCTYQAARYVAERGIPSDIVTYCRRARHR